MPVFQSVKTARVSESIVNQIKEAIFRGEWKPGDRIPSERELVEQFQASRVSVREAIRILELSGMLVVRPGAGGGTIVAEPSFAMVGSALQVLLKMNRISPDEIYRARFILEPAIAEMAAINADEDDIANLEEIVQSTKSLVAKGKPTRAESYNFHFAVAQASKSTLLSMLMSSLLDVMQVFDTANDGGVSDGLLVVDEHESILNAIRQRNSQTARQLTLDHLTHLLNHVSAAECL